MRRIYGINAEMAGKTGTTNDNSDGWFMGYTPSLTFGAWVGGEERKIHFNSMQYGQGAAAALPIAALFMQKVYANQEALGYSPDEHFAFPVDYDACGGDTLDVGMGTVEEMPAATSEPEGSMAEDLFGL